jgi:hypothetical protein
MQYQVFNQFSLASQPEMVGWFKQQVAPES